MRLGWNGINRLGVEANTRGTALRPVKLPARRRDIKLPPDCLAFGQLLHTEQNGFCKVLISGFAQFCARESALHPKTFC